MREITFVGRVVPEALQISAPTMEVALSEQNVEYRFKAQIEDGSVHVHAWIASYSEDAFKTAYVRALAFARGIADLVSFSTGFYLHLLFDRWLEGEESNPVAVRERRVASRCESIANDGEFAEVAEAVLTNHNFRLAMHDLASSLGTENYSAIGCGRAVDALRQLIAGGVDVKSGWSEMRRVLNISREYLQFVTDASTAPRHGMRTTVIGSTHLETMLRSWTIMDRYIQYVRGGQKPLPITEFPEL